MPRFGTLDVAARRGRVPQLASFEAPELALGEVTVLQVTFEMAGEGSAEVLPPALNPSVPPHVTWLFYRGEGGLFGAFTLAQTRVGARAGLKPRGFLVSAVTDNAGLGEALSSGWGYEIQLGKVEVRRHYDRIMGRVRVAERSILEVDLVDPTILSGASVPFTANLQLADTPLGLRLVQVDAEHAVHRAEVGRPELHCFDGEAWGEARLVPTVPIVGSLSEADVTLPSPRFVCDPEIPASEGTVRLPAHDIVLPAGS